MASDEVDDWFFGEPYGDPTAVARVQMAALDRRVRSMIVRGTIKSTDDGKKKQLNDLDLEEGFAPTEVERFQEYGFTSRPKAGAEVIALHPGGNRDHAIVITAGDRRFRLTGMEEGEMAIHDDQGQKVHMKRAGVYVETDKKAVVLSPLTLVGEDNPGLPRVITEAGPSNYLRAKV